MSEHNPQNLQECFAILDDLIKEEDKVEIRKMDQFEFSGMVHFSIGAWIRNHFHLWDENSPLVKKYRLHGDSLSGMILDAYYEYLTK